MNKKRLLPPLVALVAVLWLGQSWAVNLCPGWDSVEGDDQPRNEVFFSPYTYHWQHSEEHRPVFALSLSRRLPDNRFCGASLFRNSFGQPSAYVYVGKNWDGFIPAAPRVYAGLSAGVIYGYKGKYKDKVPLNFGGFAPAIIPSIGYRLGDRGSVEMQVLGSAAVMFGASWRY